MMSTSVRGRFLRLGLVAVVAAGVLACGACQGQTSARQHSVVGPADAVWSSREPVKQSGAASASGSGSVSSSASVRTPDPSHRPTGDLDSGIMTDWHDLVAGDCFTDFGDPIWFTRVSCAQLHHFVVIGVASLADAYDSDAEYPNRDDLGGKAIAVCQSAHGERTGSMASASLVIFFPDESEFRAGDRHVVCAMDDEDSTTGASDQAD